mgnify:FL=1
MLIFDTIQIGNKLLQFRKKSGFTQAEVAEAAGLSDRTYADIERGTVNMKIETVLRICNALKITPNEILTEDKTPISIRQEEIFTKLSDCSPAQRTTALDLVCVYLNSLS